MATIADLNRASEGRRWKETRWSGAGPLTRTWARVRCHAEQVTSRVRVPARVYAAGPVEPGERILAFAHDLDGRLVIATDRALRHQATGAWSRLGWEQLTRVTWDGDRHTITITGVFSGDVTSIRLHATDGSRLADLAHERVGSTVLLIQTVPLTGHSPAQVAARRQPGTEQITWQVHLGNASDASDPALRSEIAAAIAELRAHLEV